MLSRVDFMKRMKHESWPHEANKGTLLKKKHLLLMGLVFIIIHQKSQRNRNITQL